MVKMVIFIICYILPQLKINTLNFKITCSVMLGLEPHKPHFCITSCSGLDFANKQGGTRGTPQGWRRDKRLASSSLFFVASCGLPALMSITRQCSFTSKQQFLPVAPARTPFSRLQVPALWGPSPNLRDTSSRWPASPPLKSQFLSSLAPLCSLRLEPS